MKTHPFRGNLVARHIFRERLLLEILNSPNGRRVIQECLVALDQPVNSDEESRKFVFARYAIELDILWQEMKELTESVRKERLDE